MNLVEQLPTILVLIFLIILMFRMKSTQNINTDKLIKTIRAGLDQKTDRLIENVFAIAEDDTSENPVPKPTENAKLLDALVYYFAQSQTSRAVLYALSSEYRNEVASYDQIAKTVEHTFTVRNRNTPPRTAINKTIQLLQGAHLIELKDDGFKATALGRQLCETIAQKG